jgi:hypothetical protein
MSYRNITAYYSVFLALLFLFSYTLRSRQYGWERGGGCVRFSTSHTIQLKFTLHLYFQHRILQYIFKNPQLIWQFCGSSFLFSMLQLEPITYHCGSVKRFLRRSGGRPRSVRRRFYGGLHPSPAAMLGVCYTAKN